MSVYKVISNYYNDLLNFLSEENSKNNGLENLFQTITNDKKKIIITKLADMMVRFDMAFENEISFWKIRAKQQNWYTAIYIIMLIIIFVIIIILFLYRVKELKDYVNPEESKLIPVVKSLLSHIIVFQVLLSIVIVLLVNITSTKKLCNGQIALLREDKREYSEFAFRGSQRGQLANFFTLLGYWKRNIGSSKSTEKQQVYKTLFNGLQKDSSYDSILPMFAIENKKTGSNTIGTSSNDDTSGSTHVQTGVEIRVYDSLAIDISSALIAFYDQGRGYKTVKKELLKSSPILMLKEARRIMSYYYLLSFKKQTDDAKQKEKQQDALTNIVINPLYDLLKAKNPTGATDTEAINENERDPVVNLELRRLFAAFTFLIFFLYPIYIKTSDTDNTFSREIRPFLPQNIVVTDSTPDKDFVTTMKASFMDIYQTDYSAILQNARNMEDPTPAVRDIIAKITPLFRDLYYRIFLKIKGTSWFPFNKEYIDRKLTELFETSITASLPDDYKEFIVPLIYDPLIIGISESFDILSLKRSDLIDTMSSNLVPLKINILTYQNYIINSVLAKDESIQKYMDDLTEFLVELSNATTLKEQLHTESNSIDQKKFMEADEFIELLQNLSFNDIKKGFEVNFFKQIVEDFYKNISESVNLQSANNRNIYYKKQQTIKIWKVATTMVIIALILLLTRTLMSSIKDYTKIKRIQIERDCDKLFAERDLFARKTNFFIKIILPVFIVVFIIALIIAYRKKMEYTFKFNVDIVENNTNELKNTLEDFSVKLSSIRSKLNEGELYQKMSLLDKSKVTDSDKKELFEMLKNIVDKYEKCNYIIESAKTGIPFPYPEVIMNGFMLSVALLGLLYALSTFAPMKRLKDIKKLNKLKARVLITDNIQDINEEITSHAVCHNEDMDAIVIALKLIFFTFIIMFLIFYSVKIVSSADDFGAGLYNSSYFEESRCYE